MECHPCVSLGLLTSGARPVDKTPVPPPLAANNTRRHTRLACEIPVRITSPHVQLDAFMVDASRSGLRLRVPGAPLGLYPMAPLSAVGQQVAKLLGVEFEACLHPVRLGSLLVKRVRPVRIGTIDAASADFELGCALSQPLSDEESAMLELGLHKVDAAPATPPAAVTAPAPTPIPSPRPPASVVGPMLKDQPTRLRVVPPPAPATGRPGEAAPARVAVPPPPGGRAATAPAAQAPAAPLLAVRSGPAWKEWHAYVHPVGGQAGKPFLARIDDLGERGLQIRVPDRAMLALDGALDVTSTMAAMGASYGSDVTLRLMDGSVHLWTGQARIDMLAVGEEPPHPVTLGLSFKRPLRPEEARALEVGPA
ncbi:MAG: PilZ domain-containing protein [Planctomycetia bacterium]